MSYFAHETAAERYAHGRPYFHPLVAGLIRERLGLLRPGGWLMVYNQWFTVIVERIAYSVQVDTAGEC